MEALVPQIEFSPREEWFAKVKEWKTKYPFTYVPSEKGARMKPQEVVEELDRQAEIIGSESLPARLLGEGGGRKRRGLTRFPLRLSFCRGERHHHHRSRTASDVGRSALPMEVSPNLG